MQWKKLLYIVINIINICRKSKGLQKIQKKKIMIFDPVRDGDLYNVYSHDYGYDTMIVEKNGIKS